MKSGRVRVLPHGMLDVLRQGNLAALLLPLALLAAGGGARALLARKPVAYSWHGVTLAHPAGWAVAERSADSAEGDSVVLMDLLGPGRIKPRVTLRIAPLPSTIAGAADVAGVPSAPDVPSGNPAGESPPVTASRDTVAPAAVAPAIAEALSNRLPLYYPMSAQEVQVGGSPGTRVDSAFAFTPRGLPGRKGDIPVVMRAIDLIVLRASDALSIQVAAPIEDFEAQRPTLEAIVSSLRITAPAEIPQAVSPPTPDATTPTAADEAGGRREVTVAGQVIDAESGLAIPGAIVVFLAPGTNVADVTDDNLTEIAYTTGLADSTGHFASTRGLAGPARYGVMVVADGYHWIGSDDGVSVAGETPSHLDVGAVHLRRR